SGNYSVSVSDGRPCYDTLNFVVTAADTMFTSIIGSNLSCAGDGSGAATAQTVGGTINYSYAWNNGGTVATLTGVNAGTYEVSVTDSLGCINIESVIITEPLMLYITLAAIDALCYNDNSGSITTSVFGGTTGYSYLWSTGEITENVSNLFTGEYSVTVTDTLGCDTVNSVTLLEPAALSITMSSTSNTLVQCNGTASAFVSGGVSPYSYLWNDAAAQTSNPAIDLCADNFEVDVLDANGCAISDTISVQNEIIDGVFENTPEQGLMIYPNPATSFVVIGFSNNRECTVRLFDVAGKLVYKNERFNNKIRIESLNSGMYFYEVKDNNNESYSGKLLITK
ncbi:MAG: T9SS type A sorting domain-containing protein, partial [Flavobacteriales bacterium]|nr:T9SS type A sorting domain-containing protein [Flavobacteriales bacterium]